MNGIINSGRRVREGLCSKCIELRKELNVLGRVWTW